MLRLAILVTAALGLAACSDDYAAQERRLIEHVSQNPLGDADTWLVTPSAVGEQIKVALVFGFPDDDGFCEELVALLTERVPSERYACEPVD